MRRRTLSSSDNEDSETKFSGILNRVRYKMCAETKSKKENPLRLIGDLFCRVLLSTKSPLGSRRIKRLLARTAVGHKFGSRTRCLLLLVLSLILLCIYQCSSFYYPLQGWELADTCIADDCHLRDPLLLVELPPNLLLVLIHSNTEAKDTRDAIRFTWVYKLDNHAKSPIQYRFVVYGSPEYASSALSKEASDHKDILMVTEPSGAGKTLASFKHAYKTLDFSYIMKCDDSTFVDVMRIATELYLRKKESNRAPLWWWGYFRGDDQVSPWELKEGCTLCDRKVTHASSGGYVVSREVVGILAAQAQYFKYYGSEDVSMGIWLAPYNVELKHDARFNTDTVSRGCKDPYLVVHGITASQMSSYQESALMEGRICSWRTYNYASSGYIFNWTTPASSVCCKRNSFVP